MPLIESDSDSSSDESWDSILMDGEQEPSIGKNPVYEKNQAQTVITEINAYVASVNERFENYTKIHCKITSEN